MINDNVLVDTNILIHDFMSRIGNMLSKNRNSRDNEQEHRTLTKLASHGFRLHVASFAITQLVSILQDKSKQQVKSRYKYPIAVVEKELEYILAKYIIISFGEDDIKKTVNYLKRVEKLDIEDNLVYHLAMKAHCDSILTYNIRDYDYLGFMAFTPYKDEIFEGLRK